MIGRPTPLDTPGEVQVGDGHATGLIRSTPKSCVPRADRTAVARVRARVRFITYL